MLSLFALLGVAFATFIHYDVTGSRFFVNGLSRIHPGNPYTAQSVLFWTGDSSGAVSAGSLVTLNSPVDEFEGLTVLISAISDPNLAVAQGGVNDLLMIFAIPALSVNLTSDKSPREPDDITRLIALSL